MEEKTIKSKKDIAVMSEGGKILSKVKRRLKSMIKPGVRASEVEKEAVELIKQYGAEPSFMKVPGYYWATCINVGSGLVHGIPTNSVVFRDGDLVSVDLGVYYKGFHTDSSFSLLIGKNAEMKKFISCGENTLNRALDVCRVGNKVSDISQAIEDGVKSCGYSPIRALTGHGVGKSLHEDPAIPCFRKKGYDDPLIEGMVLAVEVMYAEGDPEIVVSKDGWTISMRDGKIAGLFEETVAITRHGPVVLTKE